MKTEPMYIVVQKVLRTILRIVFRFKVIGLEKAPTTGPAIVAANHISYVDPLCSAYLVDKIMDHRVRFLAKAALWKTWYGRLIFGKSGQIPVERGSGQSDPTLAAQEALREGKTIMIYPESTITTNADLTPMRGKTGVARLTLATGVPVTPVAIWGAQWWKPKGRRGKWRGHRDIYFLFGDPMRFPEFEGKQDDPEALREVTDRVMAELDRLVRELHKVHPDGGAVPPLKEAS